MTIDYAALGLHTGLEFHQRLDTHKLFCNCSSTLSTQKKPDFVVTRKLRPVAGELGEIDPAAMIEFVRGKAFEYYGYDENTCLVECDSQPPGPANTEALDIVLEIALLLNCDTVEEVHVMRKTVIDGSNTAGFQRTMMIGQKGFLETPYGKISITGVFLEEEAAGIVSEKARVKTYRLDRLGIPLVEIATGIMELEPGQVKDVALRLGRLLRVTGKVQRGLGTIRQDLNVSIKGGARVEIKGVQDVRMLDRIIENEVKRQLKIIKSGKKPEKETRKAMPDGTTEYMRPLPGAHRMYPETDLEPIQITKEKIIEIKKSLPEKPEQVFEKLKKEYKLSDDLANRIITSKYAFLFYDVCDKLFLDPTFVANTFVNTLTALKREGIKIETITPIQFKELFKAVKQEKISKQAVPEILKKLAGKQKLEKILEKFRKASKKEVEEKIEKLVLKNKALLKDKRKAFNVLMGKLMCEYRGKIEGSLIAKLLRKKLE